jgi:hypothetical protein
MFGSRARLGPEYLDLGRTELQPHAQRKLVAPERAERGGSHGALIERGR